jgi:uncharacterized glyoxalase superfamily protein PhnB
MAEARTETIQRAAVPMLSYENVAEAADWLVQAFGFRETGQRYTDDEGRVTHAEVELEYGRLYNAADLEGHRWMFMQAEPHS